MSNQCRDSSSASRRDFLRTSAAAVAGSALAGAMSPPVHAAGGDTIKVALVGCGALVYDRNDRSKQPVRDFIDGILPTTEVRK